MQINNDPSRHLQTLLSDRPGNQAAQKAREEHLQKLGDQFLNKLEPAQAREILFRQIAKRLSQLGNPQPVLPQAGEPAALVKAGTQLQTQGIGAEQIRRQMQQGLVDGRTLMPPAQLQPQTRAGLEQFEQQLNHDINASTLAASYQQDSYSQSNSAAIEIRTKEGDTITIHLSAEQSGQSNRMSLNNGRVAASMYESIQNNSSQMKIEIDGELNEEELKGITNLLQKINGLADKFFSGQDQAALSSIGSLQMNDSLEGFNLKLSSHEQNSQSTAQASGPLQFIQDFVTDSNALAEQAGQLLYNQDNSARQTFSDILSTMLQLKHRDDSTSPLLAGLGQLLQQNDSRSPA